MRYIKFSILTGIGLFALAMFFLSQSMQDFLNLESEVAQSKDDLEILDFSLDQAEHIPDLSLDFPAGSNQAETIPVETTTNSHLTTAIQIKNQNQRTHKQSGQTSAQIKLLNLPDQQDANQKSLNILLLSQTTKQQRTTLIEELIRLDGELVRQIAFKPTFQQNASEINSERIQQTSLSNTQPNQTVAAKYSVPQNTKQNLRPQNSILIQKETPIHLVASLRGVRIKTTGIAQQNGSLNQTIQVVPLISNTIMNATVISKNLARLNLPEKLTGSETRSEPPTIKLSEVGEFQPSEIIKLTGTGLVVGLNGTGDRTYTAEAIQALKSSIKAMNINLNQIKNPIQIGNVANVSIIAFVPNSGVNKGQRLKCYITADSEEIDLTGGYLLPTSLLETGTRKTNADAIVMGPLLTDQTQKRSQAVITKGAQLLTDLKPRLITNQGLPHLKLFLKNPSGQPQVGQLISQHINQFLQSQNSENSKAILRSSSLIMISLPSSDQQQAQDLANRLLTLPLPPQVSANLDQNPKLIIDTTKAEIQTQGTVFLRPAKLEYTHFTLEIASLPPSSATKLSDLLTLMQHIHIPETKQILFLRTLQQQKRIRATYREF